jgi:antitoxin FitA
MPAVVVRNLSQAMHTALKARAAKHGRSTEAEIRAILESAVLAPRRIKLGSRLAALVATHGPLNIPSRDRTPAKGARFE